MGTKKKCKACDGAGTGFNQPDFQYSFNDAASAKLAKKLLKLVTDRKGVSISVDKFIKEAD